MLPSLLVVTALLLSTNAGATEPSLADYDVDQTTGLRMERYRAPVPADIPGGATLTTEELKADLPESQAVLIDVYPPTGLGPDPLDGHWVTTEKRESVPGTIWLPEVGRGTLDAEATDYFKRNLARLTDNQRDRALVFFCTADCWQSWNASRRAIIWGYTAVRWYPLGTDGWLESGGSLVPVQPVNFFDDTTPVAEHETRKDEPVEVAVGESASAPVKSGFPESGRIILIDQTGSELDIGEVVFSNSDDQATGVSVEIDHDQFTDQFLSMRPFRCLTNPAEWFCYLPYPYELKKTVTPDNLTELEYQLLFIWKSPKTFGIDAWNGVYYKMSLETDGTLNGQLLQGDLNVLAAPPEPYSYPIDLQEFINEGADNRLYPSLVIRP